MLTAGLLLLVEQVIGKLATGISQQREQLERRDLGLIQNFT